MNTKHWMTKQIAVFTENVFFNDFFKMVMMRDFEIEVKELDTINDGLREKYFVIEEEIWDINRITNLITFHLKNSVK